MKPIYELGWELRAHMRRAVTRKLEGVRRPALMLSGGIDSTLLAVVLHDLGVSPHVLTVAYGDYESEDNRLARRTARSLWPAGTFEVVHVRRTFEQLERHAREVINFAGCSREAMIEVSLLMWEALRHARRVGCDGVLVGCEAGAMFACDRFALKSKLMGPLAWRTTKAATLHNQECGWPLSANQVNRYYAEDTLGLRWLDPYLDHDLIRFHMPLPYETLNYKRDKGLAHVAYPLLARLKPVRYSMQSKAGVPRAAEILVAERGHKTPLLFYNSIARAEGVELSGDVRHLARFVERVDQPFADFIHSYIREANAARLTAYQTDCLEAE